MNINNHCLNCGQAFPNGVNYCSNCGQKTDQHRLALGHLIQEAIHFVTHADKGIFVLIKGLAHQPGIIAREYIAGKRKKIFSPLNFFLLSVALFLFVQTTFNPLKGGADFSTVRKEVLQTKDLAIRERQLLRLDRREQATNFMAKYSNIINFLVIPLVAGFFYLAFRKAGYNYTEHLVANLFFAGFNALVFVVFITPYLVANRNSRAYFAGVIAFLLFEIVYRSIAYQQFTARGGIKAYLYCLLVSLVSVGLWYIISGSIMGLYIATGFRF